MSIEESSKKQLEEWYNGVSTHNNIRDECCPDFSCCNREIKTPFLIREKFCNAVEKGDEITVNEMLVTFLNNLLKLKLRKGKTK